MQQHNHTTATHTHRHGNCRYPDGSRFEGEWQGDQRHGWGSLWTADGQSYEGEWANGAMHGGLVSTGMGVRAMEWAAGSRGMSVWGLGSG